jgi:hypothetical protein
MGWTAAQGEAWREGDSLTEGVAGPELALSMSILGTVAVGKICPCYTYIHEQGWGLGNTLSPLQLSLWDEGRFGR